MLADQHHDTAALGADQVHRVVHGDPVGAAGHVIQQVNRVHAHQNGLRTAQVALHQGEVLLVFDRVGIYDGAPVAAGHVAEHAVSHALHQTLGQPAVGDQIGDRTELEIVPLGEGDQVRQTGHGAVVVHDLADHRRRGQPRLACNVDRCLSVAGAHQCAALARHQREDVARRDDVVAAALGIDRDGDGSCAVVRGNPGGDPLACLDREGERRLMPRAVMRAHQWQPELLHALAGKRKADQAARMARHEVDRVGGGELRRHDEIAFVLPVLVVDQDEHPAIARLLDQLLGARQVMRQLDGLDVMHHLNSASRAT